MKVRLIIEISGGVLSRVYTNNTDVEYVLVDDDNIKAGDKGLTISKPDNTVLLPLHRFYDGKVRQWLKKIGY